MIGKVLEHFLPATGVLPCNIAALILFVVGYVYCGWGVLKQAAVNIAHGRALDENFLMSIATLGAFAIGDYAEALGVMVFYRVGEYFEDKAVEKSRSNIMEALDLRPEVVNLMEGARCARSLPRTPCPATWCWCGPVTGCRWTVRCWRARACWILPPLPASRCRWLSAPATASPPAASTRTAH